MAFLFNRGRSRANVTDLPKQACDLLAKLDSSSSSAKVDELAKNLSLTKATLQGTNGTLQSKLPHFETDN